MRWWCEGEEGSHQCEGEAGRGDGVRVYDVQC